MQAKAIIRLLVHAAKLIAKVISPAVIGAYKIWKRRYLNVPDNHNVA